MLFTHSTIFFSEDNSNCIAQESWCYTITLWGWIIFPSPYDRWSICLEDSLTSLLLLTSFPYYNHLVLSRKLINHTCVWARLYRSWLSDVFSFVMILFHYNLYKRHLYHRSCHYFSEEKNLLNRRKEFKDTTLRQNILCIIPILLDISEETWDNKFGKKKPWSSISHYAIMSSFIS